MKKLLSVVLILVLILSVTPLCYAKNTDTLADWNIRITVPDGKTAVLKGSEYYIYGQHEGSIPYVMLRPYRYDDPGKFIMDFTEYMQGQYADFTVTSPATRKTIGNKRCWEIDYGYTVSGYAVTDRRIVVKVGELVYMFASKEIGELGMTIGGMLDDVVAAITGVQETKGMESLFSLGEVGSGVTLGYNDYSLLSFVVLR